MATFTITIRLGNDAMQSPEHVAAALHRTAREVDAWSEFPDTDTIFTDIRDANGNEVGSWKVS